VRSALRAQTLNLIGPSDTVYTVSPGVLDSRALLAFTQGQCHGLALALAEKTGWPLVKIESAERTCLHVCVERPDGALIDVTGAHTAGELQQAAPGTTLRPTDADQVECLTQEEGWAAPATAAARLWADAVLERAENEQASSPLSSPTLRRTAEFEGLRIRFDWSGRPALEVSVQQLDDEECWTLYSVVQFPKDSTLGAFLIDFTPLRLEQISDAWLIRQFDPAKAQRKLVAQMGSKLG
jgi:hypothetical protein